MSPTPPSTISPVIRPHSPVQGATGYTIASGRPFPAYLNILYTLSMPLAVVRVPGVLADTLQTKLPMAVLPPKSPVRIALVRLQSALFLIPLKALTVAGRSDLRGLQCLLKIVHQRRFQVLVVGNLRALRCRPRSYVVRRSGMSFHEQTQPLSSPRPSSSRAVSNHKLLVSRGNYSARNQRLHSNRVELHIALCTWHTHQWVTI
jgi:hypothetical protein